MIARALLRLVAGGLAVGGLASCAPADRDASENGSADRDGATAATSDDGAGAPSDAGAPREPVVNVTARDYAFIAPAEIRAGWTTFRMANEGAEEHFLLLNRLPEGRTFEEYAAEVGMTFDRVWRELRGGAIDRAEAGAMLGRLLPEWYASVTQMGGPGLVSPGGVATTTVRVEPGTYVMECYVKTPDGDFHASLGMARPLLVTGDPTDATPPGADIEITLTNRGMTIAGTARAGERRVAVRYAEQPPVGLGNDVHLVRLSAQTDVEELVAWMDWMNPTGLRAPAPAEFLGGAQEMPAGETAYFTATLEPGRYAWISEPTADPAGVREFAVE